VDKLRHSATAGLSLTELDEDVKEASFTATLSGYAAPGGSDLEYRWWAVSGLAMDTREFGHQYGNDADLKGNENLEFTYFPITSPIEELTIVAQFPPEYLEKIQPKPWVRRAATGSPRQWDVASQMEAALSAEGAIRIYKAMNVVSMRIPNPVDGVAYGIQWHVPEAPKRSSNLTQSERDIKEMLKQWMISGCAERVQPTMELLARCVNFAREKLMGGLAWTDPLEASIFFFDAKKRVLPVLAAALCSEDELKQVDYDQVALPYGRGIAGRAFKTNRIRAYEEIESDEPDYYYPLSDHPRFPVLACIPIQNPQAPEQGAYAVLGLGSQQSNCPLAALGKPPLTDRELAEILKQLNLLLFQELSRIYLAPKGAQSKTGAASGKTQGLDPASPGS